MASTTGPSRGRAYWAEVYRDWRASGLRIAAYCREHGLRAHNLYRWRRIFEQEDTGAASTSGHATTGDSFVELRVVDDAGEPGVDAGIELLAGQWLRIRLSRDFDPHALRRVLATLEAG